jgi:hypothetical protein
MGRNKRTIILFFGVMLAVFPRAHVADGANSPVFPEKKELQELIADESATVDNAVDPSWGSRNPFDAVTLKALLVPPPSPAVKIIETQNFVLTGTFWGGSRPSAIINDEVVGLGGKVQNMTVKDIREGSVVLTDGQNEVVLSLQK